jgi:hypothetical protein
MEYVKISVQFPAWAKDLTSTASTPMCTVGANWTGREADHSSTEKIKFNLEQAMKTQMWSIGIGLLFL